MRGLKTMRLIAVGAAVALASTACGGGTGSSAEGGGTLVFALHEPEHLIPGNTNETQGGTVLQVLYDLLVDYSDEGEPVNQIAEDISSEDQKTWTVKIKKGWKFHNGESVTSDSFIDAWNFTAYGPNANGNSYFMDRIEGYADLQMDGDKDPKSKEMSGLKKIDDQTFEVTLAEPYSGFPLMLGYTAFAPMAQECLEDTKACEEKPIGTGPFEIDGSWEHDRSIKTKRFEDYAGEAAKLDRIEFRIFKDEDAEYSALQSREVDMIPLVPVAKMGEVRSQFGERFIEEPNSSFTYLGFPTYLPEFKDKRLRQAFSLALDRETIVKEIFDDRYAVARSLVSPVVPGSRDDACKYCEYDPERAKKLLEEAGGWPKGKKLPLWFNAGVGNEDWVEAAGNQLKENLGIDFTLKGDLEFAKYLEVADQEKFTGPYRLGWVMDYPSPENYLKPVYGTQGSSNNAGYSNPAADKLLAEGDKAPTLDEGIESYQAAEDLILEDMPVIPLWFGRTAMAYNDNVGGVNFNIVDSNPDFTKITVS